MNKKIFAALIVLVLATLACGLPTSGGGQDPVTGKTILFQDDFSSTGSGWDRYSDADMVTDYAGDAYNIQVLIPSFWSWANPGESFSGDVSIKVDATAYGPLDNGFGIICRYQDVENFYIGIISSDGYAGIGRRYLAGDIELISGDAMVTADAIVQGTGMTNSIQFDCIGSSFTLYANGTPILTATDSSILSGDVGLIATSFSEGGVDVSFDNFVVTEP